MLGVRFPTRLHASQPPTAHPDLWEQVCKCTNGGGLSSSTVTHDHDTANLGVNDVQDQCKLHLLLTDNGGEGELGASLGCRVKDRQQVMER